MIAQIKVQPLKKKCERSTLRQHPLGGVVVQQLLPLFTSHAKNASAGYCTEMQPAATVCASAAIADPGR